MTLLSRGPRRTFPHSIPEAATRRARTMARAPALVAAAGILLVLCSGCVTPPAGPPITAQVGFSPDLREGAPYKLLRPAVEGVDRGFTLLFIPILNADQGGAMRDLYRNAGVQVEGKSIYLANMVHDRHQNSFLLFAIPTVKVTADVVELEYEKRR